MAKCEICGEPIKGEIATSFANYHFACYVAKTSANPNKILESLNSEGKGL